MVEYCVYWLENGEPMHEVFSSLAAAEMYSCAIRGKENIEWVEVSEEETIDLDELEDMFPDAVPERPKVLQVHPVGCAVPNPPEQHNGRTQIVSHMVVIMENTFAQVIYIYVLVFFILDHLAEEERDIFQVIPVYILH